LDARHLRPAVLRCRASKRVSHPSALRLALARDAKRAWMRDISRTCIPLPSAQACSSEMSRIQARFASLASARRKALISSTAAGDPHPSLTVPLLRALVEAGADILELGVPFSDPMADGPVIQRSGERALK